MMMMMMMMMKFKNSHYLLTNSILILCIAIMCKKNSYKSRQIVFESEGDTKFYCQIQKREERLSYGRRGVFFDRQS